MKIKMIIEINFDRNIYIIIEKLLWILLYIKFNSDLTDVAFLFFEAILKIQVIIH